MTAPQVPEQWDTAQVLEIDDWRGLECGSCQPKFVFSLALGTGRGMTQGSASVFAADLKKVTP